MNITFSPEAWEDYQYWQKQDQKVLKRIHALVKEIQRNPFEGMGKPEALKHNLSGFWSRRINEEHRIVYGINNSGIVIIQLRYHYGK